jgi:hypothetical protein
MDGTLAGSIKRKTRSKGRKEEERARTQVRARSAKAQSGSQRGKERNKLFFRNPTSPVARSISEKDREGKPERAVIIKFQQLLNWNFFSLCLNSDLSLVAFFN